MKALLIILSIVYLWRLLIDVRQASKIFPEWNNARSFERFKAATYERINHIKNCDCKNCKSAKDVLGFITPPTDEILNRQRLMALKSLHQELSSCLDSIIEEFCLVAIFSIIIFHYQL